MKKKIKSYWHHASLDDDITSLGAISSSLQLIMLHIMAWNGRTDRPSEKPAVCLSTTCPLHSQTLEVTLVLKHTLASLFFTTGLKVHSDNWLPLQKSHAQSGTNVTAGNFHTAANIKWAGWIWHSALLCTTPWYARVHYMMHHVAVVRMICLPYWLVMIHQGLHIFVVNKWHRHCLRSCVYFYYYYHVWLFESTLPWGLNRCWWFCGIQTKDCFTFAHFSPTLVKARFILLFQETTASNFIATR